MSMQFGPRRATYVDIGEELSQGGAPLDDRELGFYEDLDLMYRSLCGTMFNFVPQSGHPGGSISSGRFVAALLFETMAYDLSDPQRPDADMISFAAGHKALGLYAMWALRNEVARIADPTLLPGDVKLQLRMEDLIGFRRNPITSSPLFSRFGTKPLDGHPTPATPFLRLSTGASGVGVASSLGLAFGAADRYGIDGPKLHIVEGEGGMTPGRVAEAMAAAGTSSLGNAFMHIDWNQASIDSDRVCRDGDQPGDYVQWDPMELAWLHDWNVVFVPDGHDFQQVVAAQRRAVAIRNGQPTAIVYRTVKGWQYGIEGRKSHGAGHALCSDEFHRTLEPLIEAVGEILLPPCDTNNKSCRLDQVGDQMESCFWTTLSGFRQAIERSQPEMCGFLARRVRESRERLEGAERVPREGAPDVETIFSSARDHADRVPDELAIEPGGSTTLRGELGKVLSWYNKRSGGAILAAAADLLGSTSISASAEGFEAGYWNGRANPQARTLSIGGICEDAMCGILSGISSFGYNVGAGSSYGAFIAPLGHIAARLHAIGNMAKQELAPEPYRPFFLVCAHAGLKTGEDGPTHADPQALQVLQENFPKGTAVVLTPWDPAEVWSLVTAALIRRPAVIAPFVTRPAEPILDRAALGLPGVEAASKGVYAFRRAQGEADATVVLQGSAVAYAFLQDALPKLVDAGVDPNVFYVASAELFDLLQAEERETIFPSYLAEQAIGITDFTLPTMFRWIGSERGRAATLHAFRKGRFLGSGQGHRVLEQAGLDGASQFDAIVRFVKGD